MGLMRQKLLDTGLLEKLHFTADTIQEVNKIKAELEKMGYKILIFKVKDKESRVNGKSRHSC